MHEVGTLINRLLKKHNLWNGYRQFLLVENWHNIVGPSLSLVTRAESLQRGTMKVVVKDSVWAYHLSMLKPQLIKKLNEHAGGKIVKDIIFLIGEVEKKEN